MSLIDVIKGYIDNLFGGNDESTPLEDFGGGFSDLDDMNFGRVDIDMGTMDALDVFYEVEEVVGDRLINDFGEGESEEVTIFYDLQSLENYLEGTPESVLRVYVDILDEDVTEYHVYRYPSE